MSTKNKDTIPIHEISSIAEFTKLIESECKEESIILFNCRVVHQ